MGGERRVSPLTLDIGQCMKDVPDDKCELEITGAKSKSYRCGDHDAEDEQKNYSIQDLQAEIQKYERLSKIFGNKLKDEGEKIMKKLEQLYKELKERQKQEALTPSTLAKEAAQCPTKAGHDLTNNRFTGRSSAAFSCTIKQITNQNNHEQGKASAFNEPIRIFKGASSNGNTKIGGMKGRNNDNTCRGSKCKSSFLVPSSSFNTNSRDLSQEFKTNLVDDKLQTQVENSIASRVASGKRQKPSPPLQKEKLASPETTPGFAKGFKKASVREFVSSQKKKLFPELYMHKDSPGASLDTAMELSDDEEKRGTDGVKADINRKELLNHPYSLRSNFERREGFKVTYPSGDPEAVEVQQSDLKHLDPYEFLNDTVIDFYIKYLQRPEFLSQEKKARFHFFNTFFFKKLLLEKRKRRKGSSYYSKLRKWTKGVNIFEKKYLLVPVHDCAHWSLAIICFDINSQGRNGLTPYILHLDSMREGHASEEVFQVLSRYLEAEWDHNKGLDVNDESYPTILKDVVWKRVEVPLQQNAWDCGLFLLYFIECFLRDANDIFEPDSLNTMFGRQWFKPQEASRLRLRIRRVLDHLMEELNNEIMMEDMD